MGGSGGISRFFLPSMDSLRSVNSITFVRAQSAFFFRTGASLRGVLITLQLILYDCAGSILCIEPGRTEQLLVTHNDCTGSIMPSFSSYAVQSAFTAPLPTLSGRGSRRRQSGHSQVTVRSQSGLQSGLAKYKHIAPNAILKKKHNFPLKSLITTLS